MTTRATSAADPFADPAQPGRNGYVGRRYTFADLADAPAVASPDHRSHSQVETFADCGLKYRLQRREGVPQVPDWALIGGNALHAAVEKIERILAEAYGSTEPTPAVFAAMDVPAMWTEALTAQIGQTLAANPAAPMADWHAAKGGKEGYTWWQVEGEAMLRRYVDQRQPWGATWTILRTSAGVPVIEHPFEIDVDGVAFQGVIDQAWYQRADHGVVLVRDVKTGSHKPVDTFQLGEYAHALARIGSRMRVARGAYWMARQGEHVGEVGDLFARHPWDELVYRVHAMDAADRAGIHLPRPSSFCVSCSVAGACPARAGGTA